MPSLRARARAVCRTWHCALVGLPLRRMVLEPSQGLSFPNDRWLEVINARPVVHALTVSSSSLGLLPALLHSLDRQVRGGACARGTYSCGVQHWGSVWRCAQTAGLEGARSRQRGVLWHRSPLTGGPATVPPRRPCPQSVPDGPSQMGAGAEGAESELGQVPRLRCLDMLHLHILNGGGAGEGVHLPGMATLKRLFVNSGAPLAVDLGRMPRLQDLSLAAPHVLGTNTVAAATQLTRLALGYFEHDALDQPWVAELLASMPPSVRWLQQAGCFQSPVTEALGDRSQLRVLVEAMDMDGPCKLPPVTAPLWSGLCALYWLVPSYPLPQVSPSPQNSKLSAWGGSHLS